MDVVRLYSGKKLLCEEICTTDVNLYMREIIKLALLNGFKESTLEITVERRVEMRDILDS